MSIVNETLLLKISIVLAIVNCQSQSFAVECTPGARSGLSDERYYVNKIIINNADVFDSNNQNENHKLHSLANQLHRQTQPEVISRQLLFKEGDQLQEHTLQETERLLRANRYIRSASIVPIEVCGNQVALAVNTTDHWTLTPGVSYGRAGGKNKSSVELKESNLFGRGKSIQLRFSEVGDRTEQVVRYLDPQLFGGRQQLELQQQNNSDGYYYGFGLGRPFYALDSKHSWATHVVSKEYKELLYRAGEVSTNFLKKHNDINIYTGWSKGLQNNVVKRLGVGWRYTHADVGNVDAEAFYQNTRTYSYPYIQFEYLENRFTTGSNLKLMDSVEDISLGHNATVSLGLARKDFGSTDNAVILATEYNKGRKLPGNSLGFLTLNYSAHYTDQGTKDSLFSASGKLYFKQTEKRNLLASVNLSSGNKLYPDEQLVLGGETGLRGYPSRIQSGDKLALFTLEQRFYFDWYPFNVIRFGASLFADAGSSWGDGSTKPNILKDVGIGLRLVPTRHSSSKVIHIDLAVPLDERDRVSAVQFLLKAKSEF